MCLSRHFVLYMIVQHSKTCAKASMYCVDSILYACKEGHQATVAACGIEPRSENRMRHVYERERELLTQEGHELSRSEESMEQLE